MHNKPSRLLQAFETNTISPGEFGHEQHLRVAHELLQRCGYLEAAQRFSAGARALADSAGVPEKFNVTITLAFLSLVAERMHRAPRANADDFLRGNADLLAKDALGAWYSSSELTSDFARTHLLLPRSPQPNA